jgi:hypothetical protein
MSHARNGPRADCPQPLGPTRRRGDRWLRNKGVFRLCGDRMKITGYEVVCVIDERSLVDSESYQRRYYRPRGKMLVPGFYIVIRPDPDAPPRYDSRAEFVGPFESALLARAAMEGPRSADPILAAVAPD